MKALRPLIAARPPVFSVRAFVCFFPSLCWWGAMVIPFLLQLGEWHREAVPLQAFGVLLVAVALGLSDGWAFLRPTPVALRPRAGTRRWILCAAGGVAVLQVIHLGAMGKIPLGAALNGWLRPDSQLVAWRQWDRSLDAHLQESLEGGFAPGTGPQVPVAPFSIPELERLAQSEAAALEGAAEGSARADLLRRFHGERKLWVQGHLRTLESQNQVGLAQLREKASKLSGLPRPFLYLCQAGMLISPALVVALWTAVGPLAAVGFGAFSAFYAVAILMKNPLVVFAVLYLLMLWPRLGSWRRPLGRTLGAVGGLSLLTLGLFQWAHPYSLFNYRVPTEVQGQIQARASAEDPPVFTLSDHSRLRDQLLPAGTLSFAERKLNYLVYRVFLTPSEVSHRWYHYFPAHSGGYLGWAGLVPGRSFEKGLHPSNRVGRWAYHTRFPDSYLPSVHAYASVDADAYAHGGLMGLVVVSLLVALLRLVLAWAPSRDSLSEDLVLTATVVLGLFLPMASLQAIVAAQGIGVIVLFLCAARWFSKSPGGEIRAQAELASLSH